MLRRGINLLSYLFERRDMFIELVRRDFRQKYAESYLGFFWLFLQPTLYIAIIWFVFSVGFRQSTMGEVPMIVYLSSGIIAWLYFADTVNGCSSIINQHSFLVKKLDFRLSMLPTVRIASNLLSHLGMIVVVLAIAAIHGYFPSIYTLQLLYYLFCLLLLVHGIAWLTSALNVFVNDVSNIVSILVQFGFWLTPLFWNLSIVPEPMRTILQLNPAYYIVNGYRESIVFGVPFWENSFLTLWFWCFSLTLLWIGTSVFKRLRPHFAEIL